MKIDVIVSGPLGVNCCLVSKGGKLVIVDPGGDFAAIDKYVKDGGLTPVAVVNTHGHFDHIGAVSEVCDKYKIPFYLHKDDEFLLAQGKKVMQMYGFGDMETPTVTNYIENGDILEFDGIKMEVIHTPGHTPGGCCLYIREAGALITGDTLFHESVGRSDFPYSDGSQLLKYIEERVFVLGDSTRLIPGHGEGSTIGHEKKHNPYL